MGGCGQVGSHIAALCYGWHIDNLTFNDNLILGTPENLPFPLRNNLDTRLHLDFVRNPPEAPDILIFVGGRSSAPHFDDTLKNVNEELQTWFNILNWCKDNNIRLIFASTSSLCKIRPSVETQMAWPGSEYELTKLCMEQSAILRALRDELVVQICRFFSVYGLTEQHKGNFGNLYSQLLWHGFHNKPFELWGQNGVFEPGEQTRDTIYAPEVARAVLYLLTLPDPKPTLDDISTLLYNVGQGHPISVNTMIEHVEALLGKKLRIVTKEVPIKNYVVHTWGDPSKLIKSGFVPIFQDNLQNLRFTKYCLEDISRYWDVVEAIREQCKP